jgi:hypothetical protein
MDNPELANEIEVKIRAKIAEASGIKAEKPEKEEKPEKAAKLEKA